MRKSSSEPLSFKRSDYPEVDPIEDRKYITIRREGDKVVKGEVPLDYYGDVKEQYEKYNQDYIQKEAPHYYE